MYFIDIDGLKNELVAKKSQGSQFFFYFFVLLVLKAWPRFSETALVQNSWDQLFAYGFFVITVVGTWLMYKRNGGKDGEDFLNRYFPLLWVMSIRLGCVILIATIPVMIGLVAVQATSGQNSISSENTWYYTLGGMMMLVLFYWRLTVHISDVASKTQTQQAAQAD